MHGVARFCSCVNIFISKLNWNRMKDVGTVLLLTSLQIYMDDFLTSNRKI